MIANSQESMTRAGWDTTRLLSVVERPLGPDRTLDALMAFTSSKNCVEILRGLDGEVAAKLVDVFYQVRLIGLRDTLTRLTMALMTRSLVPLMAGRAKTRCRCGRWVRSVA